MDEKHERALRRQAIRLTLRGLRPKDIRKQVPRSRRWLSKWQTRFRQFDWGGLKSQSRRPHRSTHRYPDAVRRLVATGAPPTRTRQGRFDWSEGDPTRTGAPPSATPHSG